MGEVIMKRSSELPVYGANSSKQGVDESIDRDDKIVHRENGSFLSWILEKIVRRI